MWAVCFTACKEDNLPTEGTQQAEDLELVISFDNEFEMGSRSALTSSEPTHHIEYMYAYVFANENSNDLTVEDATCIYEEKLPWEASAEAQSVFRCKLKEEIYQKLTANNPEKKYLVMVVAVGLHVVFRRRKWLLETVLVAIPFVLSSIVTIIYYTSDYVGIYRDGRCIIEKRGGEGVLNRWGREVIPCIYDNLTRADFGEGQVYYARLEGKEGVIDARGGMIVPCEYDYVKKYLMTDLLLVEQEGKLGLLRLDGREVLPCEYDNFTPWGKGGLLKTVRGELKGLVSKEGEVVLPCIYLFAKRDETGLTKINDGGWVDKDNKIRGGYWGIIDEEGLMVLPCRYEKLTIYESEIRGEADGYIYYFDHEGRVKEQIQDWH